MNEMLKAIQYPTIDDMKSALFIQPHPDDNEIGAGGTMINLVQKGIPVYGLTVTEGRGGSHVYPPEELAEIRKKEADDAMKITGVKNLGCLGYHDNNPIVHKTLVKDIVKVIREVKPDAIISVDDKLENELHPVHLAVGKAVREAYFRSGQVFYPFEDGYKHEDVHKCRIIGFYFTEDENTIVDISDVYPQKRKAILAHKSQVDEQLMQMYDGLFTLMSADHPGKMVERIKLLYDIHTHCFTVPKFLKEGLKNK